MSGLVIDGNEVHGLAVGGQAFQQISQNNDGSINYNGQTFSEVFNNWSTEYELPANTTCYLECSDWPADNIMYAYLESAVSFDSDQKIQLLAVANIFGIYTDDTQYDKSIKKLYYVRLIDVPEGSDGQKHSDAWILPKDVTI